MKITTLSIYLVTLFVLLSCKSESVETKPSSPDTTGNSTTPENYVECKSPRPEACTREYKPVCAQKDTGVRCVTTPCPSTEKVTASNACTACSDPNILGYVPDGACAE